MQCKYTLERPLIQPPDDGRENGRGRTVRSPTVRDRCQAPLCVCSAFLARAATYPRTPESLIAYMEIYARHN
jgi:hypothetical protein